MASWRAKQAMISLGILLLGWFTLVIYDSQRRRGITSETELTLAEGLPSNVDRSSNAIEFTLGGYRSGYYDGLPAYAQVAATIESGEPIRAWLSTKSETLFHRSGPLPLYQLSIGGTPILTYAQSAAHRARGARLVLIGGVILCIAGAFGMASCLRDPPRPIAAKQLNRRITRLSVVMSLVVYLVLVAVNLEPRIRADHDRQLGTRPLGLPATTLVILIETLLFLPMPCVFWHMLRLTDQALRDGRPFGIPYLLSASSTHPQLRRSQKICLAALAYLLALTAALIIFRART
jgi:hypothetical protein